MLVMKQRNCWHVVWRLTHCFRSQQHMLKRTSCLLRLPDASCSFILESLVTRAPLARHAFRLHAHTHADMIWFGSADVCSPTTHRLCFASLPTSHTTYYIG